MATTDVVKGRYSSYQLLSDVGHGGSARVYRAQDTATKKEVAVKQLFGNAPQDREDWLREVDALTTLNNRHCPHVVQYLDHMQQHEKLFLVEEFAEQGSLLRQLRQGGPMAEAVACRYVFQVLATLHRMSQWGIIHGDLKASNLLLFDGGVVKLTDFALRSRSGGGAEDEGRRTSKGDAAASAAITTGSSTTTSSSNNNHNHHLPGDGKHANGWRGAASSADAASSDSRLPPTTPPHRSKNTHGATAPPQSSEDGTVSTTAGIAAWMGGDPSSTSGGGVGGDAVSSPIDFRGSVYWAAPEVLAGESRITPASDVWAVGCTAIELLTGAPPFYDRSLPNATHHVLKHFYQQRERRTAAAAAVAPREQPQGDVASDRDAADAPERPQESEAEVTSLLPPLPDHLSLSDECLDFLRLCLHLDAAERPSAGELLQHRWFFTVVVPQLLMAAREGRVVSAAGLDVSGEKSDGAAATTNSGSTNSSTSAMMSSDRFAVIEKWVELNLLGTSDARCEAWLRSDDALPLLVPVLTPRIMTPKYIGNILSSFSRFVESGSPHVSLFTDRLGATALWSVDEFTTACDADHLLTLFCGCCVAQDPDVDEFTPTHPSALRFVLGLEKAKALPCVLALHQLLVAHVGAGEEREDHADYNNTTAASPTSPSLSLTTTTTAAAVAAALLSEAGGVDAQSTSRHHRQQRARERLLRDCGAAVLCQLVESQCRTAFLSAAPPPLDWATLSLVLDCLVAVEPLPGGQTLLWGLPGGDSTAATVRQKPTVATAAGAGGGGAQPPPASASPTPRNHPNQRHPHSSQHTNTSAASGSPGGVGVASGGTGAASPFSLALSQQPTGSDAVDSARTPSSSSTAAAAAAAAATSASAAPSPPPHLTTNNTAVFNSSGNYVTSAPTLTLNDEVWTSSLSWLLAVQEAAHHCCEGGVRLLTRYIAIAHDCPVDHISNAGLAITATLVLVASNENVAAAVRRDAVLSLPRLQSASLRATRYLRDPIRCVPLLAMTLKRSAGCQRGVTSALLSVLRALTAERQTLAACAGSPWMWEALIALLTVLQRDDCGHHGQNANASSQASLRDSVETASPTEHQGSPHAPPASSPSSPLPQPPTTTDAHECAAARLAEKRATLSDLLGLLSQWFADVAPTALLMSTHTVATAAHRNMSLSPPPPAPSHSSLGTNSYFGQPGAALPLTTPTATPTPAAATGGSGSGGGLPLSLTGPAAPPPLVTLMRTLRTQLMALRDQPRHRQLCDSELTPQVERLLDALAPLDPESTAAPEKTRE